MNNKLFLMGFFVALTAFASVGFSQHANKTHAAKPMPARPALITREIPIGVFNAIESHDHVDVKVIANQRKGKVKVIGSPDAVHHFHAVVKDHLLHLYFGSTEVIKRIVGHGERRVLVEVYTRHLSSIHQGGICNISVFHLHNQSLSVKKSGSGSLHISGRHINLTDLVNLGVGSITIKNINSKQTILDDSASGFISLYGNVGLRHLKAYGHSNITISGANSQQLSIDVDTNGIIALKGVVTLSNLRFKGAGLLRIYWINTPELRVIATGSGTIALAGMADVVDAKLFHHVNLDMRYVRAENVFVKTYQYSKAYVWAKNNLFALADNGSDIYYFSKPNYLSMRMLHKGSILSVGDIPSAMLLFNPNH